ncbi:hypothetical protein N332_10318, partial [Mesitornis unicolor]
WPLTGNRVEILKQLVKEQLDQGHRVATTSPWNTPVFVVPKKNGKWRLLQDLRKVNEVIEEMGSLQPGLPSPSMIPKNWDLLIISLKDCFFTIPLDPEDTENLLFLIPEISTIVNLSLYNWVVLSQGMKNSPTMCQTYVTWALKPVYQKYPQLLIYHYMDDILIAGIDMDQEKVLNTVKESFREKGLLVATEKVQRTDSSKYLGWEITKTQIMPMQIQLKAEVKTLNDVQKLVGDINWIRTLCGITSQDLAPLFE